MMLAADGYINHQDVSIRDESPASFTRFEVRLVQDRSRLIPAGVLVMVVVVVV